MTDQRKSEKSNRTERLAAELRSNLKKRKVRARTLGRSGESGQSPLSEDNSQHQVEIPSQNPEN